MPYFIMLITLLLLSACGGGSSAPMRPAPEPEAPPSVGDITPLMSVQGFRVFGQEQALLGESISFSVLHDSVSDVDVQWRQIAGNDLALLATNSQTLGFTPEQSGSYQLEASVTAGSSSVNIQIEFEVLSQSALLSIMLDHASSELDNVSLHVFNRHTSPITSLAWKQIAGPDVGELTQQDDFLFFDAPEVNNDSLVMFELSANYEDGSSASEQASILINQVNFDRNGLFYSSDFIVSEDMQAFRQNSPYKQALESCVYNNQIPATPECDFGTLPLIGMQTNNPSIDDILDRTLVSHPWMGERFEEFLRNSASQHDMLSLLRGVSAVVISYEVRPSFYWAATGAIYLDAAYFWLTPDERDTLNDRPDFRRDFGNELDFLFYWRYTKNNLYYPPNFYPKSERQNRQFDDLEASIVWLLYHELAHANDFFPSSEWGNIALTETPLSYFRANNADSDDLEQRYPLRSAQMHELAQVRFAGVSASASQQNYDAADVATFFRPDIAPSFYAYSTKREDYATLFERFMMLHRMQAEADLGIINASNNEEFLVTWGQRNRISDPSLEMRTAFVVNRIYPELGNAIELVRNLPSEQSFPINAPWFTTTDFNASTEHTHSRQKTNINRSIQNSYQQFVLEHQAQLNNP